MVDGCSSTRISRVMAATVTQRQEIAARIQIEGYNDPKFVIVVDAARLARDKQFARKRIDLNNGCCTSICCIRGLKRIILHTTVASPLVIAEIHTGEPF